MEFVIYQKEKTFLGGRKEANMRIPEKHRRHLPHDPVRGSAITISEETTDGGLRLITYRWNGRAWTRKVHFIKGRR